MRAVAIVVCLMFVAGCGEGDGAARVRPKACETALQGAQSQQLASIAPVDGAARARATSWVLYEDLDKLARASQLIVRGHVIEDCGLDGDGEQTTPNGEPQMLVKIDTVYHGQSRDSILVPATSDEYSSSSALKFAVGNEVILFLTQPAAGGAFPVGGPQGHWRVVNGRAVPNAEHLTDLPLDRFTQTLAAALQ